MDVQISDLNPETFFGESTSQWLRLFSPKYGVQFSREQTYFQELQSWQTGFTSLHTFSLHVELARCACSFLDRALRIPKCSVTSIQAGKVDVDVKLRVWGDAKRRECACACADAMKAAIETVFAEGEEWVKLYNEYTPTSILA